MMNAKSDKKDLQVFLCYSSDDELRVRNLYYQLKSGGLDVWFDKESLFGGQAWETEIETAIFDSDVIIICLSNQSVRKIGYVNKEISFALDKTKYYPDGAIPIIPVLLDKDCEIPKSLSKYQWVSIDENLGIEKLENALIEIAKNLNRNIPSINNVSSSDSQLRLKMRIHELIDKLVILSTLELDNHEHRLDLGIIYFMLGSLETAREYLSEARLISTETSGIIRGWYMLTSLTLGDTATTKQILKEVQLREEFEYDDKNYYYQIYESWISFDEGDRSAWEQLISECITYKMPFDIVDLPFVFFELALGLASSGFVEEAWKAIKIGQIEELGMLYMCGLARLPQFSIIHEDKKLGLEFDEWFNFRAKLRKLPPLKALKHMSFG